MPESRKASDSIPPSRFVKPYATDGYVALATAGAKCWGISQPQTRNAPYPSLDDGYAAIADESLTVYTYPDKQVLLEIGAGGCANGDRLKAGTLGVGLATTTGDDEYGAIARGTGNEGELVPVDVVPMAQV